MSNTNYCHIKTKDDAKIAEFCNKSSSALFNSWDEDIVSMKIQLYNREHPEDNLDNIESIEKRAKKLMSYELNARKIRFARQHNRDKSFTQIIRGFKNITKRDYIKTSEDVSYVLYKFTQKLDRISKNYGVTTEQICNGFKKGNEFLFGEFALFESIFEDIQYQLNDLYMSENLSVDEKILLNRYEELLDNWNNIVLLVKSRLAITEKIKLGKFLNYGKTIETQELVDSIEEDLETAVKDPVERVKDEKISSFNKVSQITRHVLSTLPALKTYTDSNGELRYELDVNGNPKEQKTIYGTPVYINPKRIHSFLSKVLRGVKSKAELFKRLDDLVRNNDYYVLKPLVKIMTVNPDYYNPNTINQLDDIDLKNFTKADIILQSFLLDYNRAFQPYMKHLTRKKLKNKTRARSHNIVVNDIVNTVVTKYNQDVILHKATYNSLYDNEGYLRKERFDKFIEKVEFFKDTELKFSTSGRDFKEAVNALWYICAFLNIPYFTRADVIQIYKHDKARLMTLLQQVDYEIISKYKSGIKYKYGNPFNFLYNKDNKIAYSELYDLSEGSDKPKMQRLGDFLAERVSAYNIEHSPILEDRCTYKNENGDNVSIFSTKYAGYLDKLLRDIEGYISQDDLKGLRVYLDKTYGTNPIYVDSELAKEDEINRQKGYDNSPTKKFRIQWLNDLYNAKSTDDAWSYTRNIRYVSRLLGEGENNKPFEKFSPTEDAQSTISSYFYHKQRSNGIAKIAEYRVFISGDANQYKTITAPIYNTATLIDQLVKLSHMEEQFWESSRQTVDKMNNEGKISVKITTDVFSIFPAFNEIFGESNPNMADIYADLHLKYDNLVNRPDNYLPLAMKLVDDKRRNALITDYFKIGGQKYNDFRDSLLKYGILDSIDANEEGELNFEVNKRFKDDFKESKSGKDLKGKKLEEAIQNMWLNQKYAMASQVSMMTVSPGFYKNLADLQKRYKETHSSGRYVDLDAINPYTHEKVFPDEYQRTILITEHKYSCKDIDPAFMEVIEREFKDNPEIIKKYKEIEASDGQAYRTIESYRRVMLGLNQWTKDMEDFYQELLNIRENHKDGSKLTDDEFKKLGAYNIVLQPLKPFLFTKEKYENNDIPVQLKCSETVLIPELLKDNSKLKHLAEYMTTNNIDVAAMTSAMKVGSWGNVDISETTDKESLFATLSSPKCVVHLYSYKDYFMQTNVPPHQQELRLFATQIRKLIMGGKYDKDVKYLDGNIPLLHNTDGTISKPNQFGELEIKRFYNELIMANFIESLSNFLKDVNNKDAIAEILIKSLMNNDVTTLDACISFIVDEKTHNFTVPLNECINEYTVTSNIIALFKQSVNKQTILGGSGVQATSVGLEGYDESNNLHFVTDCEYEQTDDGFYKRDGKTGRFIPKKGTSKNVIYAEVEIPLVQTWRKSYIDKDGKIKYVEHKIDYDKYVNNDGTLKYEDDQMENFMFEDGHSEMLPKFGAIPLIDKDFPGIRDFIAYRIPTESDYSMINCRAVRFTRPQAGITIRVPSQGVVISGFDFDIDKLYFMFKAFEESDTPKLGRWKEYNYDKSTMDNPKAVRDNMLIHIIQQRLQDVNTLRERLTPGGFDNAKEVARDQIFLSREDVKESLKGRKDLNVDEIRQLRLKYQKDNNIDAADLEESYDYTDLETLIMLNQRNQIAGKLIGIFANQNVNHSYCSGMSYMALTTPIAFGGHPEGLYNLLVAPEGVDVAHQLAEFLAASVDAVKDPVLGYMNLTDLTANAACLLVRLGYSLNDVSLLLNQPIVKKVCEIATTNGSRLGSAISRFFNENNINSENIDIANPSQEELLYNIVNNEELDLTSENQIAILKLFQLIIDSANDLNVVVTKTKFTAANSVKPTWGGYYESIDNVDKFKELEHLTIKSFGTQVAPIINGLEIDNTYLGKLANNPMAFEQCMYDCMTKAMKALLKYFPYDNEMYTKIRNMFRSFTSFDETTVNIIHKDIPVYILTILPYSKFNPNTIYKGKPIREYILNDFPKVLQDFIKNNPELTDSEVSPLLSALDISGNNIKLSFGTSLDTKLEGDAITADWRSFITNDDSNIDIAEGLFLYNFYKNGFGYGPASFIHYAPTELKENMKIRINSDSETYTQFFQTLLDNWSMYNITPDQMKQFFMMFIANHLDNYKLVSNISGNKKDKIISYFIDKEFKFLDDTRQIIIDIDDDNSDILAQIATTKKDEGGHTLYTFSPCIKTYNKDTYEEAYYILENMEFDENGELYPMDQAIYRRIYPIGSTNSSLQYNSTLQDTTPLDEDKEYTQEDDGKGNPISNEGFSPSENPETNTAPEDSVETELAELFEEYALLKGLAEMKRKNILSTDIDSQSLVDTYKEDINEFVLDFEKYMKELVDIMGDSERELINSIYEKVEKYGLVVMNEEGENQKSCRI